MNSQLCIPFAVTPEEVAREKSLGGAITLCAKVAGFDLDKELQLKLGVDKGQFSRWQNGQEGIVYPKLRKLMDTCGNVAPLLWMNYDCGFDLYAMRMRESEHERETRRLREELDAERT
jgi:hypothetical protein